MPIQTAVNFNLFSGPSTRGYLDLRADTVDGKLAFVLTEDFIETVGFLRQDLDFIFNSAKAFQFSTTVTGIGSVDLFNPVFDVSAPLSLLDAPLERKIYLQTVVGDLPPHLNPFRRYAQMYLTDPFKEQVTSIGITVYPRALETWMRFSLEEIYNPSDTALLDLVDLLGPEIFNELPISGSSFNNTNTNISFDLIDTGGALITASSVQLAINSTLVVDAGVDVTPPAFGNTTFTKVNDSYYTFNFIPTNPFSLGSTITMSGQAIDNIQPVGNLSEYLYWFSVWDSDILYASIIGLADADDPILDNINPLPYVTEAPVDSSITFDLYDIHTGVDFNSVIILVGDKVLVSGGELHNQNFATVTQSGIYDNKGKHYEISPVIDLPFGETIPVSVYADDLYSPPNTLDVDYWFDTQKNGHIVASGFSVFQDLSYEQMSIGESYITISSTLFSVDFINTSGLALDMNASYIEVEGVTVPFTYASISGDYYYRVFFELEPNYSTDADLLFYVQQSGIVYGNTVDREFSTKLLWGYEVCYDPEIDLNFDTNVYTTISVCDSGDFYSTGYKLNRFTTAPMKSNTLYGSIIGISPPSKDIVGEYISNNTFHEYDKVMDLMLEAEDFAGNKLIYNWIYTIEGNN